MSDCLPPLTALRAFDAAARHMSFALAAAELNVTPAALSFQIKSLEEHLGQKLFRRLNRAVELTPAGRALLPGAAEGFQILTEAWRTTKRLQNTSTLTVTAGPALTAKWLAPRLYDFARAYPQIDLRFSASLRMVDLKREDVDIAIRFGEGATDGLYIRQVRKEWITPVMTPDMAARYPSPQSLVDAPLIFDESLDFLKSRPNWSVWFRAVGIDFTPDHGTRFSGADHAIDAAATGVGAVLGRRAMIIKDLQDGRLVAPFPIAVEIPNCYHFMCLGGRENQPQIAAFRDWFFAEVEKTAHISDGFTIIPLAQITAQG